MLSSLLLLHTISFPGCILDVGHFQLSWILHIQAVTEVYMKFIWCAKTKQNKITWEQNNSLDFNNKQVIASNILNKITLTNLLSRSQQQQSLRYRTTRPRIKSINKMLATVKIMSMIESFNISWKWNKQEAHLLYLAGFCRPFV